MQWRYLSTLTDLARSFVRVIKAPVVSGPTFTLTFAAVLQRSAVLADARRRGSCRHGVRNGTHPGPDARNVDSGGTLGTFQLCAAAHGAPLLPS